MKNKQTTKTFSYDSLMILDGLGRTVRRETHSGIDVPVVLVPTFVLLNMCS